MSRWNETMRHEFQTPVCGHSGLGPEMGRHMSPGFRSNLKEPCDLNDQTSKSPNFGCLTITSPQKVNRFRCVVRLLFWTEWLRSSSTNARIGRAFSDGSNVTYIRQHQLGWPNGLAIDLQLKRLWWCDAYFDQ